jgi:hypothetical protein
MSGTLALASCLVVAIPAFAETAVGVGYQPTAPVQIVEARFGTTDLLKSARFENRASKSIIAYRIAWISRTDGEVQVSEGPWMTLPADADPGSTVDVPDQKVERPKPMPSEIKFFISDVRFADGSHWKVNRADLMEMFP